MFIYKLSRAWALGVNVAEGVSLLLSFLCLLSPCVPVFLSPYSNVYHYVFTICLSPYVYHHTITICLLLCLLSPFLFYHPRPCLGTSRRVSVYYHRFDVCYHHYYYIIIIIIIQCPCSGGGRGSAPAKHNEHFRQGQRWS